MILKQFRSRTETCYGASYSYHCQDTFSLHVPRIRDLLKDKLLSLPRRVRDEFDDLFRTNDAEVDAYCDSMQKSHERLVRKQIDLAEIFTGMIDRALAAHKQAGGAGPSNEHGSAPDTEPSPMRQRSNPHIHIFCYFSRRLLY